MSWSPESAGGDQPPDPEEMTLREAATAAVAAYQEQQQEQEKGLAFEGRKILKSPPFVVHRFADKSSIDLKPEIVQNAGERLRVRPGHAQAMLSGWLIYAPGWAIWDHYLLSLSHLRPVPGLPEAKRLYPEAEYELLCAALDPRFKPRVTDISSLSPLSPVNFVGQFHGFAEEDAVNICSMLAELVVRRRLPPETSGISGAVELWQRALEQAKQGILWLNGED